MQSLLFYKELTLRAYLHTGADT